VLDYDVSAKADEMMNVFLAAKDLRQGLTYLGIAYMTRLLSPVPIGNVRMIAAQPEDSQVGKKFYENVLRPNWERLAIRIQMMMDEGILRQADPWIAAMQWKGMCEWDMFERRLMNAIPEGDPKEIETAASHAADAFLRIYGAEGGDAGAVKMEAVPKLKRPAKDSRAE
jgi:hypothetical protein